MSAHLHTRRIVAFFLRPSPKGSKNLFDCGIPCGEPVVWFAELPESKWFAPARRMHASTLAASAPLRSGRCIPKELKMRRWPAVRVKVECRVLWITPYRRVIVVGVRDQSVGKQRRAKMRSLPNKFISRMERYVCSSGFGSPSSGNEWMSRGW